MKLTIAWPSGQVLEIPGSRLETRRYHSILEADGSVEVLEVGSLHPSDTGRVVLVAGLALVLLFAFVLFVKRGSWE